MDDGGDYDAAARGVDARGWRDDWRGVDEIKFTQPVRPGDWLRTEAEILAARRSTSRPEIGVVKSATLVFNQRDEVVMRSVVNFIAPLRAQ